MNTLKIAVASLGLVSIVGLAACQSQPKPADHADRKEMRGDDMRRHNKDHHKGFDHKHGKDGRDHDGRRFDKRKALTAEQKQKCKLVVQSVMQPCKRYKKHVKVKLVKPSQLKLSK